jgi:D-hydroxyproline dehydrogenase subunit gamma
MAALYKRARRVAPHPAMGEARFKFIGTPAAAVPVTVDGQPMALPEGEMLAAALLAAGVLRFHDSALAGALRGPFCAMGSCFQCVAEVDGKPQQRTCQTRVRRGMTVKLAAARHP